MQNNDFTRRGSRRGVSGRRPPPPFEKKGGGQEYLLTFSGD